MSRSVVEHSAAGKAVGAPVTGTPYNGVALTYSLTGKAKDSGLFVIESATGQIKVASGATLDYETDDSYRETETWNGRGDRQVLPRESGTTRLMDTRPLRLRSLSR